MKKFNESSQDYKEELIEMISSKKPVWQIIDFLRDKVDYVPDGVWDISDIDFIELKSNLENLSNFLNKYPDCVIADAYQTEYPFLLATKPTIKVKYIGSGFNHGSNNIIDNCPKRILICGEDD